MSDSLHTDLPVNKHSNSNVMESQSVNKLKTFSQKFSDYPPIKKFKCWECKKMFQSREDYKRHKIKCGAIVLPRNKTENSVDLLIQYKKLLSEHKKKIDAVNILIKDYIQQKTLLYKFNELRI